MKEKTALGDFWKKLAEELLPEKAKETISDVISAAESFGEKTTEVIKNVFEAYSKQLERTDKTPAFTRDATKYLSAGLPPTQPSAPKKVSEKAPAPVAPDRISVKGLTDAYDLAADDSDTSSTESKLGKDDIRKRIEGAIIRIAGTDSKAPYKGLFDGIDDKLIEECLPLADQAIKSNKAKGLLPENAEETYPYMRDALALFYAASELGNKNAAKKAREVAYEEITPINQYYSNIKSKSNILSSAAKSYTTQSKVDIPILRHNKEENITINGEGPTNLERLIYDKTSTVYYGETKVDYPDIKSGDISIEELNKKRYLSAKYISKDEQYHINQWKQLCNLLSIGEMKTVLNDMIAHFLDGSGSDYSNDLLTKNVRNHKTTQSFMEDFSNVFNQFMVQYNGNIQEFANSKLFKNTLKNSGVLLSKYAYDGLDMFTGLEMAIHSWTISEVQISNLNIQPNGTYSGILKFTFSDIFGLDEADIQKYGFLNGFKSWYILQHHSKYQNKYKPFKTVVVIDYPIQGTLSSYEIGKVLI